MGDFDALDSYGDAPAKRDDDFGALDSYPTGEAAAAKPATVDMGPAARRARAGMAPGPRDITSEEAGTSAGPTKTRFSPIYPTKGGYRAGGYSMLTPGPVGVEPEPEISPAEYEPPKKYNVMPGGIVMAPPEMGGPPDAAYKPGLDPNRKYRLPAELTDEFANANKGKFYELDQFEIDPIAQMAIAGKVGRVAGEAVAPAAARVASTGRIGATAARFAVPAVEGAAASKFAGGDADVGAALGLAAPVLGTVARGLRGGRNPVKDIRGGTTKAPKRLMDTVKYHAGEGGADLTEVLGKSPEARRAVLVEAQTNPGGAAKTITKVVDTATDANDAAYAAIQRQHGGVPLQPLVDKLKVLQKRLNLQGRGVEADAVGRVREDWLKPERYGLEGDELTPEQIGSLKIGAQAIRNIRNDMGSVADPARAMKANTRRKAMSRIHKVLNREIEDVAGDTRGVDVAQLKARNEQISTLIPVRDALRARAESEADLGTFKKIKSLPGKAIRRGIRELDVGLSDFPSTPELSAAHGSNASTPAGPSVPGTTLTPDEEAKYQAWRKRLPKELQYEGDYDLRGFYKKNPNFTAAPGQHMTDEFKLPNHPTFSNESKYYNDQTARFGGHWEGDVFIPNDPRLKQRVDETPPGSS